MASSKPKPKFKLLGSTKIEFPHSPDRKTLETFANRNANRDYTIHFDCPEFTSMCPVTGQPDFASLSIQYVPDESCIETKSLKFYLASYRHTRSFNEEIVNRILDDLVAACSPRQMEVSAKFSPRGGISVSVVASYCQNESDIPF